MLNVLKGSFKRSKRISRRLMIVICIYVLSLLYLLFQGGKVALMLFLILTVLSVYLMLGRWSGIASVKGTRAFIYPEHIGDMDAGTSLRIQVNVDIPGFWPIPYVIVKESLHRKHSEPQVYEMTFVPDWNRRGEVTYTIEPLRRGYYHFGETVCSTEDIFGLFEHHGKMMLRQSFRILPRTVNIDHWQQFNRMLKGAHHHSASLRAHRETTQIDGVREYVYGDRLSRIHWKTTARTGIWKSKEFERESLPKMVVVLDRKAKAYQSSDQFETAVSVAASLIRFAWREQLAFGLLSVGNETTFIEAGRGAEHHSRMVNHLIEVEANGEHALEQVMMQHLSLLGRGVLTVLVTPEHDASQALRMVALLQTSQMIPCHMWISDQRQAEFDTYRTQLLNVLSAHGLQSYSVQSLEQLPYVLGGRR